MKNRAVGAAMCIGPARRGDMSRRHLEVTSVKGDAFAAAAAEVQGRGSRAVYVAAGAARTGSAGATSWPEADLDDR
jgi:hypothetical protein